MSIAVRMPDLGLWKAQVRCQAGCPVATDAGRYVQLIAERRDEEAYLVARAPNPFASVCGRVCAAPCEDACRRGDVDAPISIRALKRFVTEKHGVESVRPDTQDRLRDSLVALGLGAVALTAIFLGIASLIAVRSLGRGRSRAIAVALGTWFAAVVLFDLGALGAASLLPSGAASRLLITSVIVNPVDAIRTGALLAIEGAAAFGAASLAFLRFTGGPARGAGILALSVLLWAVAPAGLAMRRIGRTDI